MKGSLAWRTLLSPRSDSAPVCTEKPPANANGDVRYGSLADIQERPGHVRVTPESRHAERQHRRPLSANSGHWQHRSCGFGVMFFRCVAGVAAGDPLNYGGK